MSKLPFQDVFVSLSKSLFSDSQKESTVKAKMAAQNQYFYTAFAIGQRKAK